MDKRLNHIDNIAGLLIIYMILYHIMQFSDVSQPLFMRPLFFFMPWFFFKAGMFHKEKSVKQVLVQEKNHLLYPFVIFSFVGVVVKDIQLLIVGDKNWIHYVLSPLKQLVLNGSVGGNLALWFLLSLFLVKLVVSCLQRKISIIIIAVVSIIISFVLQFDIVDTPMYIANTASGVFFYCMGNFLKQRQYQSSFFLSSLVVYVVTLLFCYSIVDMRSNELTSGYYLVWVVSSLGGCVTINNLFKIFSLDFLRLYAVGRDSMIYYVWHWIVLIVVSTITTHICGYTNNNGIMWILIVSSVVVLPGINFLYKRNKPTIG